MLAIFEIRHGRRAGFEGQKGNYCCPLTCNVIKIMDVTMDAKVHLQCKSSGLIERLRLYYICIWKSASLPTTSCLSLLKIYMNAGGQPTYIFESIGRRRGPKGYRFLKSVEKTTTSFLLLADVNIEAGYPQTSILNVLSYRQTTNLFCTPQERCMVHDQCDVLSENSLLSLQQWETATLQLMRDFFICHIQAYSSTGFFLRYSENSSTEALIQA